jgi:DNA-binding LacI/PurR family transcriptional regulator
MPKSLKNSPKKPDFDSGKTVTSLKGLAAELGLSPTTISVVLNSSPLADSIPQETKDRIFEAAEKFSYKPNYFARSLRAKRSFTLGVMVPELSDGYSAMVLNGVESVLVPEGYFYITACHLHRDDLLKRNPQMLIERQVEGIIAVDTPIRFKTDIPVVTVAGHGRIEGVTNVILNHKHAAELGVGHLFDLGHRNIAFIKGQVFSSDTEVRWKMIAESALKRGIKLDNDLIAQLEGDTPSPEIGYAATRKILSHNKKFTALFSFNDVSAIGAIRALTEAGLNVPDDVSVLGFDDIYAAAYHNPTLTTIRQPLFEMGKLAAQTLLKRLEKKADESFSGLLTVEPEIVIRNSSAGLSQSLKNPE